MIAIPYGMTIAEGFRTIGGFTKEELAFPGSANGCGWCGFLELRAFLEKWLPSTKHHGFEPDLSSLSVTLGSLWLRIYG
jgi:hypothetical protein